MNTNERQHPQDQKLSDFSTGSKSYFHSNASTSLLDQYRKQEPHQVYNKEASQEADVHSLPSFTPIRVIGNGAFGYVFEAKCNKTNQKVALKRTQKAGNIISREYEVLDMLKGKENVVQMLDFFYTIDEKQRIIQNTVLEYCDRSLEDELRVLEKDNSYLTMDKIKKYTRQIFNGLSQMHAIGISHRDLKPENILLKDGEVRICDVGSSKVLDRSSAHMNTPYVVSRYYRAPELILASNKYGDDIDIWATGCIIFELITRTPMFPGDSEGVQLVENQQILGPPTEEELQILRAEYIEQNCYELFKKISNIDLNQKISIFELLKKSPGFTAKNIYKENDLREAADLIEKCLNWIPRRRISAEDALKCNFLKD